MKKLISKLKIFNKQSRSSADGIFYTKLENILGFAPQNLSNYYRAFTHRSQNKTDEMGNPLNYERLEFLGDAMLGSVIAAHLYNSVPKADEGYLTKMRSKIVSREHLNELGRDFNLTQFLGTNIPLRNFGDNIYGNLFEAFIGAIYLDKGYIHTEKFIQEKVIKPYVNLQKLEGKVISYKSLLIEWCQKEKKQIRFETIEEELQPKAPKFFGVKLYIDNKCVSKSRATSKKKAEEKAAQRAYYALQQDKSMKAFSENFS